MMKHIKQFEEFSVNEELNWWQKLLVGGSLAASLLGPGEVSGQTVGGGGKSKTSWEKTTPSKRVAQNLQKQGWTLNKVQTDTIWERIQKEKPDTILNTSTLGFNEDQFFASGKFELSQASKDSITEELNNINNQNGVITDIMIESSTDKQGLSQNLKTKLGRLGYEENNQGLSQARTDAIKNHLLAQGVSATIIGENVLSEQGTDEIDATKRYVFVRFAYIVVEDVILPGKWGWVAKPKTTYTLTKEKPQPPKTEEPGVIKQKRGGWKKVQKHGKLKQRKIDLRGVKCTPF